MCTFTNTTFLLSRIFLLLHLLALSFKQHKTEAKINLKQHNTKRDKVKQRKSTTVSFLFSMFDLVQFCLVVKLHDTGMKFWSSSMWWQGNLLGSKLLFHWYFFISISTSMRNTHVYCYQLLSDKFDEKTRKKTQHIFLMDFNDRFCHVWNRTSNKKI